MTLRVNSGNENERASSCLRIPRYTQAETDHTPVLHERFEPGEEYGGRNREVTAIVAPTWGARKGDSPARRFRVGVTDLFYQ